MEWRIVTGRGVEVFVQESSGVWTARVPQLGRAIYKLEPPHPDHWPVSVGGSLYLLPDQTITPQDPRYPPGGVLHLERVLSVDLL